MSFLRKLFGGSSEPAMRSSTPPPSGKPQQNSFATKEPPSAKDLELPHEFDGEMSYREMFQTLPAEQLRRMCNALPVEKLDLNRPGRPPTAREMGSAITQVFAVSIYVATKHVPAEFGDIVFPRLVNQITKYKGSELHLELCDLVRDFAVNLGAVGRHREAVRVINVLKGSQFWHTLPQGELDLFSDLQNIAVNVNKPTGDSLIRAAHSGDFNTMISLLEKGADINAKGLKDWTALIAASGNGHLRIVRELIDRGAAVNARATDGETALMRASGSGNSEIVRVLLSKNPDVDFKSENGATAESLASKSGHSAIVEMLLAHGALPTSKTRSDSQRALEIGLKALSASTILGELRCESKTAAEDLVSDEVKLQFMLSIMKSTGQISENNAVDVLFAARNKSYRIIEGSDGGFIIRFYGIPS
jgi:hypothetical protein